jgi:DNA-binding NtrC family response regulator
VLVVEDEFIIALELQTNLEDAGAVVVGPAHSLRSAMELARREDISVATLDLRLGRDSVSPVARLLGERGIPFIFYSGQPESDPARAEWPQCTVLSKPAMPADLVAAVAKIVGPDRGAQP